MASDIDAGETSAPGRSAAARWWLVGKYAISLVFVVYLVVSVEWQKVWDSMRTVSAGWLLVSVFYIPATTVLVASRYHRLIGGLIPYGAMLRLVIFQGAISTFLANAAGSLSYIGILIKAYKVPAELAVQSTIVARLCDLFSSMIVAGLLVAVAWHQLERIQSLVLLAVVLSTIVLVLAITAFAVARRLSVSASAPGAQGPGPFLWRRVLAFGVRVASLNPRYVASILPKALLYSLLVQVVIATAMYCNARAFHLDIGFLEAALVGLVSSFIATVPVTVFGGLGIYEVSTVGLFAVFGVPVEGGAAMILVVRTIFYLVMAIAFFVIRPPGR